jgi:protein SCO1/2
MSRSVAIWVAILFLFAGGMAVWAGLRLWRERAGQSGAGPREPDGSKLIDLTPKPLKEFSLIEPNGRPFKSSELAGKVWVASFFYASCPGFCRKQNEHVAELAREYGPKGVHFVSITVDPARDTPSVLADYADRLGADRRQWHFLTGTQDYILRVGRDIFGVSVEPETHSDRLILVGLDGKVVDHYHSTDAGEVSELREQIEHLLAM